MGLHQNDLIIKKLFFSVVLKIISCLAEYGLDHGAGHILLIFLSQALADDFINIWGKRW
jgi:hypothetical protein